MHWVLQNNLYNEASYVSLIETLDRAELPYSIHKIIPFIGEIEPDIDINNVPVICMGAYSMRHVAKRKGWYPGVFDLEPFSFDIQLAHWEDNMLNADSKVTKFKDVDFYADEMFMRPIHDSKVFAGKVFTQDEFDLWRRNVVVLGDDYGDSLNADTLVQTCSIKEIYKEFRCFVVKGKIVTASLYKEGDRVRYSSVVDEAALSYAQEMVDMWQPHEAFVIDVCATSDGYKIVEINTLNSSGMYAIDVPKLVFALEDAFN
jgi:hypothetical protein